MMQRSERGLKIARFVSLFFTALLAGITFAHVLELPNKMRLPPATWLMVQQLLYNLFGPVGGPIELIAILSTLAVAVMRRHGRAFALTVLAAILLIAALGEWFAVVSPVNGLVSGWTAAALPLDWTTARDRWEYGHAIHAMLVIFALVALILAVLIDRPPLSAPR